MEILVSANQYVQANVEQERSKQQQDPFKSVHQCRAYRNQESAQYQCAEHAPKQNPMLKSRLDRKGPKDE